jgi:hypothetical protein
MIQTKDRAGADLDIAAKNIGGVEYPRNILTDPAGNELTPASEAAVAAVETAIGGLLTNAQLRASALPVSGEVALDSATIASLASSGGLTDVQLRATPLGVTPQGEMLEALESLRMSIHSLTRTMGMMYPDAGGRMRAVLDTSSVINSVTTVSTVTTVVGVTTLANQTSIGGLNAAVQIPAILQIGAESVRRNITVS